MKKMATLTAITAVALLAACGSAPQTQANQPTTHSHAPAETAPGSVTPRAVYTLDRVVLDENEDTAIYHGHGTPFSHAVLTFVGEEQGGNVILQLGSDMVVASINPSREHPSFESGFWHHHLYAGPTAAGSPRINFYEELPHLGIDHNPEATDNTQSASQHGNLHYVVETGEFRLRFTIGGVIHDLMFITGHDSVHDDHSHDHDDHSYDHDDHSHDHDDHSYDHDDHGHDHDDHDHESDHHHN